MQPPFVPQYSLPQRNRQVLLVKRPEAIPQGEDFALVDVAIDRPAKDQILVRNIFLSVDPAQRGWASEGTNYSAPVPLGSPMRALAVGEILESNAPKFEVGGFVYGWLGWQDYAVIEPSAVLTYIPAPRVPLSAYAGVLGINGLTAKLALSLLGRPVKGETVLVSTAAGSVGSIVGQLARAAGCRAVGLTGDDDKVTRCTGRFGYADAVNYRNEEAGAAIERLAPAGIDVFFDSVGGPILDAALRRMNVAGRIVQCGTASTASWTPPPIGPRPEREVLTRRLSWSGFVIFDHSARFEETVASLTDMLIAGDLRYDEDIGEGIETAPGALQHLYSGENRGKMLIFLG
jgi:hypothetical protein